MRRTARPWAAVLSVATCFLLSACALVLPVHQTSDLKLDYETTTTVHEDAGLTAAEFERYLSEYEQFDVTYRFGTFYYGDKPIREFIDGVVSKSSNGSRAVVARLVLNRPNGEVDVYTERTYDSAAGTFGPITGMHVQAVPNLIQTAWEAADIAPNAEEISVAQTTETIDAVLNS